MIDDEPPPTTWRLLREVRWPLAGAIAVAFALGRLGETLLLDNALSRPLLALDVVAWGTLGGLAVWFSLTWVARQERRFQQGITHSLRQQQMLNAELGRSNTYLALLSDVNRRIADSATLDEVLDAALEFPARLLHVEAGALSLNDATGPIETRVQGVGPDDLARLRQQFGVAPPEPDQRHLQIFQANDRACVLLPLHDGQTQIGFTELYLRDTPDMEEDERTLLETIASEIAEAIVSARRRSSEERALYELERAIADERARIARDIHDGITQTLAFRRMRVDLWLDWLDTDREQLRSELIASKQLLREQIAELRRAIFALRPVQFDELGFVGGLHRYIVEFAQQHGWIVDVDLDGAPSTLSPTIEAVTFRILQEALTNVAKHAAATHVEVIIEAADGALCLTVRDNGRGFEPDEVAEQGSQHVGLRQMHERLNTVNGHLLIRSDMGHGTEIHATIPLPDTLSRSRS
jgi:signal transduction histidine kinase